MFRTTILAAGLAVVAAGPAGANNYTWNATNGGAFQTAGNWSPGGVPGSNDTVVFNVDASYTVSFAGATIQSSGFTQQHGTLTLDIGAGHTYYTVPLMFRVGTVSGQTANLVVASGAFSPQSPGEFIPLSIGYVTGSTGNVTITGAGSSLFTYGQFAVGYSGTGTLTVQNNASATLHDPPYVGFASGGTGTINVGSGGTLSTPDGIKVGFNGTGNLAIATGGTLFSAGNVSFAGPSATGAVSGIWNETNGGIYIAGYAGGPSGVGSVTVNSGGAVTVSGSGTGITTYASGSLTINAGGSVTTPAMNNGGALNLAGGTFTVGAGGLTNSGVLTASGAAADVFGPVQNTGQVLNTGGGVLTFHDAVVHNGTEVRTTSGGRTVFLGALSGAGPFTGAGTVEADGSVSPGDSPASVSFAGDLAFGGAATLHVELGGTTAGTQYDLLTVAGTASLAGALDVVLINGFAPQAGQQFDVLTYGSHAGAFASFTGLDLGNGLALVPQVTPTTYSLVVTPVPEPGTLALSGVAAVVVWRRARKPLAA